MKVVEYEDVEFIKGKLKEMKIILLEKQKDIYISEKETHMPNVSNNDRLQYLEVSLSDDVKPCIIRIGNFYHKVT